jgi:hypothetical protein
LAECRQTNRFDPDTLEKVEAFLNNPREWSQAHGGI